jgi:hypothetical protein
MNKKIPTAAGFVIILIASAIFLSIFLYSYESYKDSAALVTADPGKTKSESNCQPKAYAGEASIKGWYTNDGSQKLIQVAKEDLSKLPLADNDKIKIVDASPNVEKNLKNSTEKKPGQITITGFANMCNGVALASINYKDGIFRSYFKK